ncbi:NAD(P)-dependent oxidoreductase [Candidatus Woesearchaeota archaeon]|jgi:nucleoside-diphosphate-sugar epimerase|nr:NAD(P)-dependent oxidoreductase [Candidatus Woesearchaeota archaeon]MBT4110557.1 NAD(P)-dependent oxidoreductase [Candidatus Woesearchaeota archaeon]MBT4335919.1 NAD(P)-dependent oxidoreductase [Candidatus Woesearchaeota archaeon]MBT4469102.1 NAD(P)-dependent oxidoreductase [Candidatus Woesearchaeota archaeon]MBT6744579.1 NAD(P)-dependent oxidoreductase [Candidatus Woesearchaeota archaeon]
MNLREQDDVLKGKRILITGGSGFIGSHLVEELITKNISQFPLKIIGRKDHRNLTKRFGSKIDFVTGDLLDASFCQKSFNEVDIVIHLANFKKNYGYHNQFPATMMDLNSKIDSNIIKACQENKIEKLIYGSSVALYDFKEDLINESDNFCIKDGSDVNTTPNYGYVIAKRFGENLCSAYNKESGLNVIIIRIDNTFGEGDDFDNYPQIIPRFIKDAMTKQKITVFGDGSNKRTFIYVKDLVRDIIDLASSNFLELKHRVYNLSSSEVLSLSNIAELIKEILGDEMISIEYTDENNLKKEYRTISNNLITIALGERKYHSMKEALQNTISSIKIVQ